MPAHPDLIAQNAQFAKQIHKLSDTVYTAVGYAASNVHFLIGDSGIVLIDTTETTQAAENILADFRAISTLPIIHRVLEHPTFDGLTSDRRTIQLTA